MRGTLLLVVLGTGCGGMANTILTRPARFSAGPFPTAEVGVATPVDLNGDGKVDLVISTAWGRGELAVRLGNGDGTFQPAVAMAGSSPPRSVAAGDYNGDGKVDLAVADFVAGGFVSVLFGNGDGTLQAPVSYPAGPTPRSLKATDLNGDGKLDLVLINERSDENIVHGMMSVLVGRGDGTFLAARSTEVGHVPSALTVGDWNGDGKVDVAVADEAGQVHQAIILIGHGNATFDERVRYDVPYGARGISQADLNGDGKADLIIGHAGVSILLGAGDGSFRSGEDLVISPANGSTLLDDTRVGSFANAIADFDLDGHPDIAGPRRVLLGDGRGGFTRFIDFDEENITAGAVTADVNGDKKPDLIVTDRARNRVSVYLNKGAGGNQPLALTASRHP